MKTDEKTELNMKNKTIIISGIFLILLVGTISALGFDNLNYGKPLIKDIYKYEEYKTEAIKSLKGYAFTEKDLKRHTFDRTESFIAGDYSSGKISKEEGVKLIREGREIRASESRSKRMERKI